MLGVDVSGMVDFSGDISGAESRSGSCPNPASVGTHVGSADVSYEFICQFAELIRPIVILGFGFMGSFLAVRTILSS